MHEKIQQWQASGEYISYGPFALKLFVKQIGNASASPSKTLLLMHGFPESSHSFRDVLVGLQQVFDRIIMFDMIGYGLSDKPATNYSYSLLEQADCALHVWRHFGVSGGHILAHDMGDSVTTELLARHENAMMPYFFKEGIQSLTFTNGSMVLSFAALRTMQKVLLSRWGKHINKRINYSLFKQQITSAHGVNLSNSKAEHCLTEQAIEMLWENNRLQNGHHKSHLTIQYLSDRKKFEHARWLPALNETSLPIHLCWGDADAVAKIEMATFLKNEVCKNAHFTVMQGAGHFCQIASPTLWQSHVTNFYTSVLKI
jgi:pimeloyl-ACP methyl ester carboxylesterase